MELYLIRHAQSANNAKPEEQRLEDPPLTEIGEEQARHLGDWISQLRLTKLITSPFLRTLLTTNHLCENAGLSPEVRTALHEQGGCYQGHLVGAQVGRPGMSRAEIEQRFPGYHIADDIDERGWWKSQPYEDHAQASDRAERLLEKSREEFGHTDQRVAYVMHADIKRRFLEHVLPETLDTPCNVSVTKILLTRRECRLVDYNNTCHLPQGLITQ